MGQSNSWQTLRFASEAQSSPADSECRPKGVSGPLSSLSRRSFTPYTRETESRVSPSSGSRCVHGLFTSRSPESPAEGESAVSHSCSSERLCASSDLSAAPARVYLIQLYTMNSKLKLKTSTKLSKKTLPSPERGGKP